MKVQLELFDKEVIKPTKNRACNRAADECVRSADDETHRTSLGMIAEIK